MSTKLIDAAREALSLGISVVPVGRDKLPNWNVLPRDPKTGKATWKEYQSRYADESELKFWFSNRTTTGFAVVCGAISGGLRCTDVDYRPMMNDWVNGIGGKEALVGVHIQKTSRGFQFFNRTPNPGPNRKLAYRVNEEEPTGRSVAIETRGEGGYALWPPSLHPSGIHYQWVRREGDLIFLPTEVMSVWDKQAELLCQGKPKERRKAKKEYEKRDGLPSLGQMIIREYNKMKSVHDWLSECGYVARGNGYVRPGGKKVTVYILERENSFGETVEVSFHQNTNDEMFEVSDDMKGVPHDSFDWFRIKECGEDMKEALRVAAEMVGIEWQDWEPAEVESAPLPKMDDVQVMHNEESRTIILTDEPESAGILHGKMGAAVALGPHRPWPRSWLHRFENYARRFVIFGRPLDHAAEATARELEASMIYMPTPIPDFFTNGGTIAEFGHYLKQATVPSYR